MSLAKLPPGEQGVLVSNGSKKRVLSLERATEALARVGELECQIQVIDTRLRRRTARLKDAAAQQADTLKRESKKLQKLLYEFYIAHPELLEGEGRRLTLASGSMAMRLGNWTVTIAKAVEAAVRERLPRRFWRVTVTANRDKMLEHPADALSIDGVGISRIDRLHLQPNGITTEVNGPSRTIRFDPQEGEAA